MHNFDTINRTAQDPSRIHESVKFMHGGADFPAYLTNKVVHAL